MLQYNFGLPSLKVWSSCVAIICPIILWFCGLVTLVFNSFNFVGSSDKNNQCGFSEDLAIKLSS